MSHSYREKKPTCSRDLTDLPACRSPFELELNPSLDCFLHSPMTEEACWRCERCGGVDHMYRVSGIETEGGDPKSRLAAHLAALLSQPDSEMMRSVRLAHSLPLPSIRSRVHGKCLSSEFGVALPASVQQASFAPVPLGAPATATSVHSRSRAKRLFTNRSCDHCGTNFTSQWRMGPTGPSTYAIFQVPKRGASG
jgi:hypothetical protein